MDPKLPNTLDPKLKEAYDRVMGTQLPQAPASPPGQPSPAEKQMETLAAKPIETTQAASHTPPISPPNSVTPPSAHMSPKESPAHATMVMAPTGFVAPQKSNQTGSKVSGKILLIVGLVFFIVYTLFWLKFFGVTLPFLP